MGGGMIYSFVQTYGFLLSAFLGPVSVLQKGVYILVVCSWNLWRSYIACFLFKHSCVIFNVSVFGRV